MAKRVRTIVDYYDDLTGELVPADDNGQPTAQTITYAWEGIGYEIDLSPTNAEQMRDFMAKLTENSRRLDGKRNTRETRRAATGSKPQPALGGAPKTLSEGQVSRFRAACERIGRTQTQVAADLGLNSSSMAGVITGSKPSAIVAQRVVTWVESVEKLAPEAAQQIANDQSMTANSLALGGAESLTDYQQSMEKRNFLREIRLWAREQGMDQGMNGRIRPEVREAWDEAHPNRPAPPETEGEGTKRKRRQEGQLALAS